MAIDIIKEVVGLKNAYSRTRGGDEFGPKLTPRTTWEDVVISAGHINKYIDPNVEQCIALLKKHKGMSKGEAVAACSFGGRDINPRAFSKTPSFRRAQQRFLRVHPSQAEGLNRMLSKIGKQEIYPHNQEYWSAAIEYAIARGAAGAVPFWSDIAIESIREAIIELPQTIKNALAKVDPRGLIPDVSGFAEIIKWGSIGGGLFLLYWYVLRPQKKS